MDETNKIKWHVVAQDETSGQLPNGSYGQGIRITFQTENGLRSSVFIAKSQYNKESVLKAIRSEAKALTEIQNLSE
jgi:hypothetical protein